MHAVKHLITFSLSWLLIKDIWCLFQSGKKVKSPFTVLEGPFGLKQCVKECLSRKRCQTIGHHRGQLRCELGSRKDVKDVSDPDYKTAFRTDLSEYQQLLGQCANHKCDAGQKCIATKSGQLQCVTSDCYSINGYSMINSSDDYMFFKVYQKGYYSVSYEMSANRCDEDGGRLMIMDKAWKINTAINILRSDVSYFINGFKNENGIWKYSDGNDFVEIANVEYLFLVEAEHVSIKEGKVHYELGDSKRYGFICEK